MDLLAFVGKLLQERDGDVLRDGVRVLAQTLVEAEVTEVVGADGRLRIQGEAGDGDWPRGYPGGRR